MLVFDHDIPDAAIVAYSTLAAVGGLILWNFRKTGTRIWRAIKAIPKNKQRIEMEEMERRTLLAKQQRNISAKNRQSAEVDVLSKIIWVLLQVSSFIIAAIAAWGASIAYGGLFGLIFGWIPAIAAGALAVSILPLVVFILISTAVVWGIILAVVSVLSRH